MDAGILEGFHEWALSVMYSGWFYILLAVMGIFFVGMFILGVVWLFRREQSPSPASTPPDTPGDSVSSLLETIAGKPNGRPRRVLLAAASLSDLPCTVPVHIALQLASSRKCLLIDLDTKRDALAHVFDLAGRTCGAAPSPAPTPIDNLHVWPAHYFSQNRQMDLKAVLAASQRNYDIVLLNAPYLVTHPDRGRIVRCAESAVVFAGGKETADTLSQLLENGSCKILKTVRTNGQPLS